ncbi:MAG TPA: hypothetical protein PLO05_04000 [Bacteroidales bacterium]|jgi:hypothetical protein|nr:hypothetical protein [Bacteroidales bacterium]MDY0160349.1 hypothetical protein [Bacteroidales bacterium]HXK81302.1 hypothetical protein [Bacteroidales bacterium]
MGTYHKIYDIQRQLLVFFYIVFCLSLIFPAGMLLNYLFEPHWGIYLIASILYIALCAIAGAYIFVITLLPVKLMRGFDHIQNGIADGSINDDAQFSKALNHFTIKYFNYLFFDIEQSGFYVNQTGNIFYSNIFNSEISKRKDEFIEKTKDTQLVQYIGKFKDKDFNLHFYTIPVWFGNDYLGYMVVGVRNKLGRFFIGFLQDFENLFIDDQLLHIVNRIKRKQS